MDELTIEGKKYVSSKQAAKLTGYAKDYIGQLCREGRVRARLVGRSWYVLESSIKNHKFGDIEDTKDKKVANENLKVHYAMPSTWKEPKYEPIEAPSIPEIARKVPHLTVSDENEEKVSINVTTPKTVVETQDASTILDLKETWRGWFDANKEIMPDETELPDEPLEVDDTDDVEEEIPIQIEPELTTKVTESTKKTVEVSSTVPIHAIYAPLYNPESRKESTTSAKRREDVPQLSRRQQVRRSRPGRAKTRRYGFLIVILIVIALASVTLAAISTGYFDKYVNLFPQAHYISGVINYIKQ